MRREDLIASPQFKRAMQAFHEGDLNDPRGAQIASPSEAKSLAANVSGQSNNQHKDQVRTMSKTVIPSSNPSRVKNPGGNQEYVNSRQGGPKEANMTKKASIKHENPEYFKRQSDRKNQDQFPFQTKEIYKGTKY